MPLRIVTDSTADLSDADLRSLGITVVPLTVFFGGEALLDHAEISAEQFYQRLATSRVTPRTSQPATGRFQEAYAGLCQAGATEILSIHLSSRLSGTIGSAELASRQAPTGCTVQTFDSLSIAGGLGAIVRKAAEIANAGGTAKEALVAARALVPRNHISFMVDTLEYLQKGGRIGRARALLGSMLNLKPIIRLQDGEVVPGGRERSRARGIERIYALGMATPDVERVVVQHSGCAPDAEALAARFRASLPDAIVDVGWIGPVVGVYAGPNGIGTVTVERVPPTG